ncbi:hypothetical protein C8Q72DRAFT_891629 [Fomitopsis betulina]|nr:hypothetical protein C8Q72DRAFT_799107 [Fomitopsis betulina]KAI0716056.1 hypothetical protein C8Q72DRAFT_891629 [Fomitopsis betulina]
MSQGTWFVGHKMWQYNTDPQRRSLDNSANSICLRLDLSGLFDRHTFVFFPSSSERGAQNYLVAYFIQPEHTHAESFHRVEARFPESVSMEFLYARFALNVIATATISRDAVRTVKYSSRYEAELRRLVEKRFAGQRNAIYPAIQTGPSNEERERREATRRQRAMEEVFRDRYPHLCQEVTHSDDPDYQNVTWHPEVDRMQKLARVWFDHNPQIRQTRSGGYVNDSGSSCL